MFPSFQGCVDHDHGHRLLAAWVFNILLVPYFPPHGALLTAVTTVAVAPVGWSQLGRRAVAPCRPQQLPRAEAPDRHHRPDLQLPWVCADQGTVSSFLSFVCSPCLCSPSEWSFTARRGHAPLHFSSGVRFSDHFFSSREQIRGARGKSLESLEGQEEQPSYTTFGATEVQIHPRPMVLAPGPGPACWRPRSYDDGDITPTNEVAMAALHEGGGTLPRPRNMAKPRPVAKVYIFSNI